MNPKVLSWGAIIMAVLSVFIGLYTMALVGGNQSDATVLSGGSRFPNGISADTTSPIVGQVRGTTFSFTSSGSLTSTGTTSLSFLSSSATQGVCMPFNATSTNTLLNMTFGATTTNSTVGIEPIISYGACQ